VRQNSARKVLKCTFARGYEIKSMCLVRGNTPSQYNTASSHAHTIYLVPGIRYYNNTFARWQHEVCPRLCSLPLRSSILGFGGRGSGHHRMHLCTGFMGLPDGHFQASANSALFDSVPMTLKWLGACIPSMSLDFRAPLVWLPHQT
jgi:hypothetical protein